RRAQAGRSGGMGEAVSQVSPVASQESRITRIKMEVTRTLARFIVTHEYRDIPEQVRHEAARSFLNWMGCAVGACRHETIDRAIRALAEFSGPAAATGLRRGDKVGA